MAITHKAEKKRKAPVGPSSALPQRYRLVQNATPQSSQKAPQQGRWIARPPQQQSNGRPPTPQQNGPRPNTQQALHASNANRCFSCGSSTHFTRECPQERQPNQGQGSNQKKNRKQTVQVRQAQINFTTLAELPDGALVMSGTFSIHNKPAVILFDSGASHSFISPKFGAKVGLNFCHTKRS